MAGAAHIGQAFDNEKNDIQVDTDLSQSSLCHIYANISTWLEHKAENRKDQDDVQASVCLKIVRGYGF